MKKTTLLGFVIAGAILTTTQINAQNATRGGSSSETKTETTTKPNKADKNNKKEVTTTKKEKTNKGKAYAYGKHKGEKSGREFGQQRRQDATNKPKQQAES